MPLTKTDGETKWVLYQDYMDVVKEREQMLKDLEWLGKRLYISTGSGRDLKRWKEIREKWFGNTKERGSE